MTRESSSQPITAKYMVIEACMAPSSARACCICWNTYLHGNLLFADLHQERSAASSSSHEDAALSFSELWQS